MLKVLTFPHPILNQKAEQVDSVDAEIKKLITDMVKTMYSEDGVGLAAPQVGVSKHILVYSPRAKKGEERALINLEIIEKSKEEDLGEEGCLSVPGLLVNVMRSTSIKFKASDETGKKLEEEATGFPARIIQHELDHLNGILLINHLNFNQRQKLHGTPYGKL